MTPAFSSAACASSNLLERDGAHDYLASQPRFFQLVQELIRERELFEQEVVSLGGHDGLANASWLAGQPGCKVQSGCADHWSCSNDDYMDGGADKGRDSCAHTVIDGDTSELSDLSEASSLSKIFATRLTSRQQAVCGLNPRKESERSCVRTFNSEWRTRGRSILNARYAEVFFNVVILVDCVLTGIDDVAIDSASLQRYSATNIISVCLNVILWCEFLARLCVLGVKSLITSGWMRLDAVCTVFSLLDLVLQSILVSLNYPSFVIAVLRLVRLVRLARAARIWAQCRALWILVCFWQAGLPTMLWSFVLLLVVTYTYALFAVNVFPNFGGYDDERLQEVFGDLLRSMLTLCQVFMQDSVAVIYRPLILESSDNFFRCILIAYFASYVLLVSVALTSLITALMVESAAEQSQNDREIGKLVETERRRALLPEVKKMFRVLDTDSDGELSLADLAAAPEQLQEDLLYLMKTDDLQELFRLMDDDFSGTVKVDEFIKNISKAQSGDSIMKLQLSYIVSVLGCACSQLRSRRLSQAEHAPAVNGGQSPNDTCLFANSALFGSSSLTRRQETPALSSSCPRVKSYAL
eukprot:TRINITY_DN67815_c0_g1_i1.p1 TRINITY_DN67815_c0_g1~~TRINITY_DN67815_c0_g1_i1.p1  ORF type:complete len:590 (-),score=67.52 TRINITY_DN67815_c0_g1_i1:37-1785(-)